MEFVWIWMVGVSEDGEMRFLHVRMDGVSGFTT